MTSDLPTSRLLLLPAELRDLIFIYTLGGNDFAIQNSGKLARTLENGKVMRDWPKELNLLLVNRQIYFEVRLHIYRFNTFSFSSPKERCIAFFKCCTQEQIEAIQTLLVEIHSGEDMLTIHGNPVGVLKQEDMQWPGRLKGLKRTEIMTYRNGPSSDGACSTRDGWESRVREITESVWSLKPGLDVGAIDAGRVEATLANEEWRVDFGSGRSQVE